MRLFIKISVAVVLVIVAFVIYTFISTGYFRSIKPMFDGELIKKISIKGAEDIMISQADHFAIVSATDRTDDSKQGGLYLIDLKSDHYATIALTASLNITFRPHGISFFKKDSTYHVLAINHTSEGHAIEVFELNRNILEHKKTLRDPSMVKPNDIVMIDENRFYFTNDHRYTEGIGRKLEDFLGLSLANVIYFDGERYHQVAGGIAYANGINFDKNRNLMFVASPRHFLVKVYNRLEDGALAYIEDIPCGTGVDNIEFDESGHLWIGCHPNLMKFSAYMSGKEKIAPSEVIKITYHDRGDYTVETVFTDDGNQISGSTVAAVYNDLMFVGNVRDDNFLILKKK